MVAVDPDGTFPFQEPYRIGKAVFRGNAQQKMNLIGQGVTLLQLNALLLAELPKNLPDLRTQTSIEPSPPVFWNDHHMILTVPLHVGLTTPVFHSGSSCALWGLPQEDPFLCSGNGGA